MCKYIRVTRKQIFNVHWDSWSQVRYACAQRGENIGHQAGRPAVLSTEQVDQLVA